MRKLTALLLAWAFALATIAQPSFAADKIPLGIYTGKVKEFPTGDRVGVNRGGTGATTASGTSLDNITGFASTGFLTRTGAGTYAFQSTTNGVTLGNLAQIGANTMLGNWSGSTANVAAQSMPSCADTGGNHLNYVSGTGITCGSSSSGGGGGGAITLIEERCLASASASETFSSLGSYSHLRLVVMGRSSLTGDDASNVSLRFNSDTGANYDLQGAQSNGVNASNNVLTVRVYGGTALSIGTIPAANSPSNGPGIITVELPFYAKTVFQKMVLMHGGFNRNTTDRLLERSSAGLWRNAAAITAIEVRSDTGNFLTGTCFSLYGIT